VYQTEAPPPATISAPTAMIVLIGAPVTGSACPALTPPLGVAVTPLTPVFGVGLDLVGGTVSTCAVGLVALGAGLVGWVVDGVVGVVGVAGVVP
jgi:hypothetical protein